MAAIWQLNTRCHALQTKGNPSALERSELHVLSESHTSQLPASQAVNLQDTLL